MPPSGEGASRGGRPRSEPAWGGVPGPGAARPTPRRGGRPPGRPDESSSAGDGPDAGLGSAGQHPRSSAPTRGNPDSGPALGARSLLRTGTLGLLGAAASVGGARVVQRVPGAGCPGGHGAAGSCSACRAELLRARSGAGNGGPPVCVRAPHGPSSWRRTEAPERAAEGRPREGWQNVSSSTPGSRAAWLVALTEYDAARSDLFRGVLPFGKHMPRLHVRAGVPPGP